MAVLRRLGSNFASRSMGPRLSKIGLRLHPPGPRWYSLFIEIGQVRDVNQRSDVDRKLEEDGDQDVEVEDVAERSFTRQFLNRLESLIRTIQRKIQSSGSYLRPRDAEEANRHENAGNSDLVIAKLDAVEILYRQAVGSDQTVKGKNLVHLNGGYKGASSLADDVGD